jgi:GT2 family glycosyltransferase
MNSSENLPRISVVIPNHNGAGYLEACLRSLLAQPSEKLEIVVVDNASVDQSVEMVTSLAPKALLLKESRNLGFAGGVNEGIRAAHGEWIAVLNNDTELALDWLAECIRGIQTHPQAAFFACRILDFGDRTRIYSAGDCFLRGGIGYRRGQELQDREDFHQECEIFSASGCAALFRREVLAKIGAYDERFFAYLEDVDLGLRIQAQGHHGFYLPRAVVYHHGAATSGGEFSPLAVRLRTQNALLLLLKNMPMRIIFRCLPMVILTQLSWLARVIVQGRLGSYIRGLGGACRHASAMIRERNGLEPVASDRRREFWNRIRQSESMARKDFERPAKERISLFLKWYFRLF